MNFIYFTIPCLFFVLGCSNLKKFSDVASFENNYSFNDDLYIQLEQDTVPWKHQLSAFSFASKGEYFLALDQWDLAMRGGLRTLSEMEKDSFLNLYKVLPAKEVIAENAKNYNITIINEAHHNPRHRFFTKSLLEDMYANGYRHLGLEALGNGKYLDTLLNERGYPVQSSGLYTKDPQFGDMIRYALELGYHVFPYETTSDANGKLREIEQAENIKAIIDEYPEGKFIIHCGFDHVLEGKHSMWEKAMAARLTDIIGEDILTVDQVNYSERGNYDFSHPLLKAIPGSQSFVLVDKNNEPFKQIRQESYADIAVFHPRSHMDIGSRPSWIWENDHQNIEIDISKEDFIYPVMVMAYKENEDISSAIPADLIEIASNNDRPSLALREGRYILLFNDRSGKVKSKNIAVK